jgi:hypothetical protein
MKLSQIALKFFGISFPPSGNTVVFLFGDPAKGGSGSKIGWYAAYNRTVPPTPPGTPPPPKLVAPPTPRFTDVAPELLVPISRADRVEPVVAPEAER